MRTGIKSAALAAALLAGTAAMALAQGTWVGNRGSQDNVGNTSGSALNSSAAGGIWTYRAPYAYYGTSTPYAYGTRYGGYGSSTPYTYGTQYGAYGSSTPYTYPPRYAPYHSSASPYGTSATPTGMYGAGAWGYGR